MFKIKRFYRVITKVETREFTTLNDAIGFRDSMGEVCGEYRDYWLGIMAGTRIIKVFRFEIMRKVVLNG